MTKVVSWTPHEKQKLADEYNRLRMHANGSQEYCLQTAMIILPEHRRKNVANCSSKILRNIGIPAENPRAAAKIARSVKASTAPKRPMKPNAVMVDTKAATSNAALEAAYRRGADDGRGSAKIPGAIGIATEQFIGEIAKEVAGIIGLQVMASVRGNVDAALHGMFNRLVKSVSEAVLKEVGEAVRTSLPAPVAAPEPPVQNITFQTSAAIDPATTSLAVAPRDRKPKVVIIGLMSQQQQEIRKEFSEVCDLTFLQSQTLNTSQLDGRDMAFIMIKFSKHSAEDDCRRRGIPFYRVTGGVSHLRGEIRKWVNGEIAITEVAA